jgi:hypothetical protein
MDNNSFLTEICLFFVCNSIRASSFIVSFTMPRRPLYAPLRMTTVFPMSLSRPTLRGGAMAPPALPPEAFKAGFKPLRSGPCA